MIPKSTIYILFSFILMYASNNSLKSQQFEFGLKGGINAANLHGTYIYKGEELILDLATNKVGARFTAGGLIRYYITSNIALQSELLYTTSGTRFHEPVTIRTQDLSISANLTLTYIAVPVLFRLSTTLPNPGKYFIQEPGFTFNVYTGGQYAYKTNAKFTGDLSGIILDLEFAESFVNDVGNQFADTDISFVAGAGFEYGVSNRFIFDIRYVVSLMDIGNDQLFPYKIRNGMVSVLIGVVL
jgi:hypothetical protein